MKSVTDHEKTAEYLLSSLRKNFTATKQKISDGKYRLGIVKFGHGQVLSGAMSYDMNQVLEDYLTSEVPDSTGTDFASAIKYASTLFKNPETSKIVVLSDGIETDKMEFVPLKNYIGKTVKVDGFFFTKSKYGEQVVIVGEGFLINIPKRYTVDFKAIRDDASMLQGVLDGKLTLANIRELDSKEGKTVAFDFMG